MLGGLVRHDLDHVKHAPLLGLGVEAQRPWNSGNCSSIPTRVEVEEELEEVMEVMVLGV